MKNSIRLYATTIILFTMRILTSVDAVDANSNHPTAPPTAAFGPSNPFYAPSTLPFKAPPFDKIKDEDFQPAIEAGIAQQQHEIEAIANNPQAPTFDNTIVAMEKSGQLLDRVMAAFGCVTVQTPIRRCKRSKLPKLQDSRRTKTSSS
jgi:peptidyl-dipeptidase Dcp